MTLGWTEDQICKFWSKVNRTAPDTCWIWESWKNQSGYGRIKCGGRSWSAHRVSYELLVGPIPDGLELDHLCSVRDCVNPDHLEPVTHAENVRRGRAGIVGGARQRAKTHCPKGHPYDAENTYWSQAGRACKACNRASAARRYWRLKAERSAA